MAQAKEAIAIIQGLVKQMENLQTAIAAEENHNTRLQLQTFQAVTALNIHMLNMNVVLLDALGAYDKGKEDEEDEEVAHQKKILDERNAKFLNNQNKG